MVVLNGASEGYGARLSVDKMFELAVGVKLKVLSRRSITVQKVAPATRAETLTMSEASGALALVRALLVGNKVR